RAVIIATGSEVEIALAAQSKLSEQGIPTRIVSMPCMELFEAQNAAYRDETLGGALPKVAVEAGVRFGWDRWIGNTGDFVGMTGFGASAPYKELYERFGITPDAIVAAVKAKL
ncbi:MAG: transketolase-like TK C-terminal-containing protein, partial [Henriciella sp.]